MDQKKDGYFNMKTSIINISEDMKSKSGKDLEQWLLRVAVLYILFGEHAIGLIQMVELLPDEIKKALKKFRFYDNPIGIALKIKEKKGKF